MNDDGWSAAKEIAFRTIENYTVDVKCTHYVCVYTSIYIYKTCMLK